MELFYTALFGVAAVLAAVLEYGNRAGRNAPGNSTREFAVFRNNYLLVYSLMMGEHLAQEPRTPGVVPPPAPSAPRMLHNNSAVALAAGDWLQGPYVYALYQYYGFERGDIGKLFIAGFGSSMVFGTIVGSLADKQCVCRLPTLVALLQSPTRTKRWYQGALRAPPPTTALPTALPQWAQARGPHVLRCLLAGLLHQALQQLLGAGGRARAVRHRHLPALLGL